MHTFKRILSSRNLPLVFGVGLAAPGAQQAASDPVQTWITVFMLAACLLPILMAIFGALVMRFLSWFTRQPDAEDEVVLPRPMLPPGVHLPEPTIWPAALAFGLMFLVLAIPLRGLAKSDADVLATIVSTATLIFGVLLALLGLAGWIVLEVKEFRLGRRR